MTSPSPHDLYRRWLDELWGGQPGAAEHLVSEDFVGYWPDRDVRGPSELAAIVAETRAMFSKLTFTLAVGPLVEGDLVAGRWTGVGTTSNGTTTFFGNDILRVDDDRFVEYWTGTLGGNGCPNRCSYGADFLGGHWVGEDPDRFQEVRCRRASMGEWVCDMASLDHMAAPGFDSDRRRPAGPGALLDRTRSRRRQDRGGRVAGRSATSMTLSWRTGHADPVGGPEAVGATFGGGRGG